MNTLRSLLSSLALSVLLAGSAIAGETVNINTADAVTIDKMLLNIGPAKAQAIVDYRKAHGAYKSVEQLALVKGIGLKTVEKNRGRISVSNARRLATRSTRQPAMPAAKAVIRR